VPIECKIGEMFDFTVHEVVFDSNVPGCKKNEIIYVMESGYKIGDRVLRVAKVGVAKGEE
jgi:molecular chaperone GrpE